MNKKSKSDKRNKIVYISIAVLLILIIGFNYYINNIGIERIPVGRPIPELDPIETKPISDDKDYVDNEIIVTINKKLSESELKSFFNSLAGLKEYSNLMDNTYDLTFDITFYSRNELNNYCKVLKENAYVEVCEANNIIKLDDCSKGPC